MTRSYFILTMQMQLDGWSCHTASSVGYLLASFCRCHRLYTLLWPTLMSSKSSEVVAGKTKRGKQYRKFSLSQYGLQKKTEREVLLQCRENAGLGTHKHVQEAQVSHTRFWGSISKCFCFSVMEFWTSSALVHLRYIPIVDIISIWRIQGMNNYPLSDTENGR